MSSANGPRYAPEDPTLPKPWRGLIDGKTGYLYFWNPETNVTQYERPVAKTSSGLPPPTRSSSVSASASAHAHRSSSEHGHRHDDGRYNGSRSHHDQSSRGNSTHSQSLPNGSAATGYGASQGSDHGYNSHSAKASSKLVPSNAGGGMSVESYRRQHEITVMGSDVPAPFMTFESTGFSAEILKEVRHAGFSAPTPIQAQSWPIALQNRDVVAVAKTGSGKTLGYLFPGFIHLSRLRNDITNGPTVLVLAPTRELATQILDEAVKFGKSSRISCTCLYGGAPKAQQLRDIARGVQVVVATPGRLNDILESRRISLRQVSYLVLDEADRMLDMGFEPQIRKIVKEIPSRRQTLMFTATWPKEVRKIAADLLVNPVQVNIGAIDELVANKSITQYVEVITSMEKQRRLEQILRSQEPGSKILIFCSTKRMCDQLSRNLTRQFGAAAIHGDKSQSERDYVLNQFKTGRAPILVATDVAARGLDIKDIRVVINYDFPTGIEDYVHRIGRTGRAGATGVSYTFFSDQDAKHASDLIKVLEGACQRVPAEIRDMAFSRGGGRGKFRRWGTGSGGRESRSFGGRSDSDYGRSSLGSQPSGRSDTNRGGREQDYNDRYVSRTYHDSFMENSKSQVDVKNSWGNNETRSGERGSRRSRSHSPNIRQSHVHDSYSSQRPSRSRSRSAGRNHGGGTVKDHSRSRSRSRSHDHNTRYGGGGSIHGWSQSLNAEPSSRSARATSPIRSPRQEHPASPRERQDDRKRSPSPYKKQDQDQERSAVSYGGQVNHNAKRDGSSPYEVQDDRDGKRKRSLSPYNHQEDRVKMQKRSSSPYDTHDNKRRQERSPSPYDGHDHDGKRSPSHERQDLYGKQSPLPHERQDHDGSPYQDQNNSSMFQGNNLREVSPYSRTPSPRQDDEHASPFKEDNGWQQPHTASGDGQLEQRSPVDCRDDGIVKRPMRSQPNPGDEEEEGMIPVEEDGVVSSDAGWATRG